MVPDTDALIQEYIEVNPYHPGPANVRLRPYAVPVWALINYWYAADSDAQAVASAYHLPLEAVQAAIEYYRRNVAVIDARIAANAA